MFIPPRPARSATSRIALMSFAALVPGLAGADEITARSTVEEVTLYPSAAAITRDARVTLAPGRHELTFEDIPVDGAPDRILSTLKVEVTGATLGPIGYTTVPAREASRRGVPEVDAAFARVEELEAQLRGAERDVAAIRLEAQAAEDTLAYLSRLGAGDDAGAEAVIERARLIRAQSLEARQAAAEANARAGEAEDDLDVLKEDLAAARADLERLSGAQQDRLAVTLTLDVEEAGEIAVALSYMVDDAFWQPVYTADLDSGSGEMVLTRGIQASQTTGEAWIGASLTFATDDPARRSDPAEVHPWIRRIFDPVPMPEPNLRAAKDSVAEYAPSAMAGAASLQARPAQVQVTGLNQSYAYPEPATLYSQEGATEFSLAELPVSPELVVRAVPLYETTGYLMATFTNDSGETLVPGPVRLIRDGVSLGQTMLETLVDGAETDLSFGAMDGIRVERIVLDRNEGDRGVISRSTEETSAWRIEVENFTSRAWPVEVIDRVSVSEQEDLKIGWSADPMPGTTDLEDRRGVLSWTFDLAPGETREISLEERLRWPEGKWLQ
ncbi:DUF4139 domain-containing protein [Celeribacter indicus]|uniref:DUF4139 domain-containing protein n=1 Tax=Celeribacter indicus TaxID=1208324 RepID=UPI0006933169|nr:DUF4139 domain-containing protein [Celeribacter indicus]SDX45873.1 conserved hypothetical protein [Celeribacter indicus]